MNREQKAAVIEEITAQIQEAEAVFAVDYRGITVVQAAELRGKLREADATLRVVKNTLTERALLENYAAIIDELIRARPPAAKGRYLRTITLASTMGPGVKVDPSRTRDILEESAPAAAA